MDSGGTEMGSIDFLGVCFLDCFNGTAVGLLISALHLGSMKRVVMLRKVLDHGRLGCLPVYWPLSVISKSHRFWMAIVWEAG